MEMDSQKRNNSLRKRMRRRSHTRKVQQDCTINMAEARREITHALLLHRSSSISSPSSTTTSTSTSTSSSFVMERQPTSTSNIMLGNSCNYGIINPSVVSSQYCYALIESMPRPEALWSTTAPSTHAAPPPPPPSMESLEFEWGENQASSYTWWLGFLETLDANNIEKLKYPYVENIGKGNSQDGSILKEPPSDQNSSPDEWLMFPTTEHSSEQL